MFRFLRKAALLLGLLVAPSVVLAQLGSVPYTFTSNTTISSSEVNTNFSTAYSTALNRTGGTMTGTLTARAIAASADATYDIGTSITKFRDAFLSRDLTVGDDITATDDITGGDLISLGTLDVTSTATLRGAVNVTTGSITLTAGGITASSGTITAATFSGSGASLSSIPETAITDGSLLARVGGTETITGAWTFTNAGNTFARLSISDTTPALAFFESDQAADHKKWNVFADGEVFTLAPQSDAGGNLGTLTLDRSANMTGSGYMAITNNVPLFALSESDQASGGKVWAWTASSGTLILGINAGSDVITVDTNILTVTRSTGALKLVNTNGTVTERNRSFAMGATQTRAFSAGNFVGAGGGTWTVESGDVRGESWRLTGDTMDYSLDIRTSTVSGTVTEMQITMPNTAAESMTVVGAESEGTNTYVPVCQATNGSAVLKIIFLPGSAHITGTNVVSVNCHIAIKVS